MAFCFEKPAAIQAVKFGEALLRGEPNRRKPTLTIVSDKVRDIV